MKNSFIKALMLLLAVVSCGFLTSCEEEQAMKQFNVTFKEAGPGYVTLMATVPGPTQIAYMCETSPRRMENPSIIFMSGTRATIPADGEFQLMADIKANQKYYIYLVARLSASEYSQIFTIEFETEEFKFDNLATVVAVGYDGYKMHISVPESVKNSVPGTAGSRAIRYNQCCMMMANYMRGTNKTDDYFSLLYNAGDYVTEDKTLEYSETVNWAEAGVDVNEDGVVNEEDLSIRWNPIAPGEPVVFVAGEFEWMQIPADYVSEENYNIHGFDYPAGWEPGYYLPCIDSAKYWGNVATKSVGILDWDMPAETDEFWTGVFQRKIFRTRVPDKLDAKIDVEVVDLGPVDGTVVITPDSKIKQFCFGVFDQGSYDQLLELLDGREEYLQWAVTSYFAMYNFGTGVIMPSAGEVSAPVTEIQLSKFFYDVPADTKYHVLVTGMGAEDGSTQCFEHYEFSTPAKIRPYGPDIEVTALPDSSSAYSAAFNIKCTSVNDPEAGKVVKCYYGANYYKDWILSINRGSTYYSLGQSAPFTQDEIDKINSKEGLTIRIPSIDGERTRLVVVGYNDENTPNDLNYEDIEECPAVADFTTPYNVMPFVNSSLLNTDVLEGDWTLEATVVGDSTFTSKVSILRSFEEGRDYPSELPADVLQVYKDNTKWTDEEIYGYFEEFKAIARQYNEERLSNQNKLLLQGWLAKDKYGRLNTMSPWDLFKDEKYSGVDVKTLFSDFGPKMFIEVSKSKVTGLDSLSITADMYFLPPAAYWSVPFYMAGYANKETNNTVFYYSQNGYYAAPLVFPVELSSDKQELTIKPLTDEAGEKYYPNLIGSDPTTGMYILDYPIISDVKLTKGWTETSSSKVSAKSAAPSVSVDPVGDVPVIVYKSMTRFEDNPVQVRKVEADVMTVEKMNNNMERYVKEYLNQNK